MPGTLGEKNGKMATKKNAGRPARLRQYISGPGFVFNHVIDTSSFVYPFYHFQNILFRWTVYLGILFLFLEIVNV